MRSNSDLKIVILVDVKDYLVLYVLENLLRIIPNRLKIQVSIITYQLLLLLLQPIQSENCLFI
jgi:hypothetical protein